MAGTEGQPDPSNAKGGDECRRRWSRSAAAESEAMNTTTSLPLDAAVAAPMTRFERELTVWVRLCIVVGIAIGHGLPGLFQAIGRIEIARVNLPVGLLSRSAARSARYAAGCALGQCQQRLA